MPGAPIWLRSTAATMHADQRRSRVGAHCCGVRFDETAENDDAPQHCRTCGCAARRDGCASISSTPIVRRFEARTGRAPTDWHELVAARRASRRSARSRRRAVRDRSSDEQRPRLRTLPAVAAAPGLRRSAAADDHDRARRSPAILGPVRRQLPQRLHLPAAARRVAGPAALALPALRRPLSWFDNIPVLSWLALARPLPPVRRADRDALPDRRDRHRRGSWVLICVHDAARARCSPAGSCSRRR